MNRLIIAGSPRQNGRSAALANLIFETCIEECPDDELALVPLSEVNIKGCCGCGGCFRLARGESLEPESGAEGLADESQTIQETQGARVAQAAQGVEEAEEADGTEEGREASKARVEQASKPAAAQQKSKQALQFEHPRRCALDDDMADVYELVDDAEELIIVSPVYFAGPPSQLKALLDRLQPYFAATADERAAAREQGIPYRTAIKPATLHVVGEGSDPYGFSPLVSIVSSAIAVAGFKLETVLDWVGKIDQDGEILEEADVIDLTSDDDENAGEGFGEEGFGEGDFDGESGDEDLGDESRDDFVFGKADADAYELSFSDGEGGFDAFDGDALDEKRPAKGKNSRRQTRETSAERPRLRLDDTQVKERGRASSEAGRSGGSRGRTDKRAGKGGTQTNNRNPRKENQTKARKRHAANASGASKKSSGGSKRNAGKGGRRG